MSEVNQEQEQGGLAGMQWGQSTAAPTQEKPAEPVAEEPVKEEPKAEEPKTEQPKETPEAKEDAPKEEPKAEEEGVITVDFGEDAPKVVDNDTETLEAYKTQLSALQEEITKLKEQPTLDPRIAKLNEIVANGGDINQAVWDMQSKDYSKLDLSDLDNSFAVVTDKLKYIDNDDKDLVDFYLDDKYPTLRGKKDAEDYDSDEEFSAQKRKEEMLLRKEAKQHVSTLKEFQDKMRLPEAPNHKQQEEAQKAIELYKSKATTAINEIDGFEVNLADELKLKFPFSGEGREFAKSIVSSPENQANFFVSRYAKEDGTVDFKKFNEDMYFLQNRDRAFNSIYAQGKSAGKKEAVQELQGENGKIPTAKPPTQKTDKKLESMANLSFSKLKPR